MKTLTSLILMGAVLASSSLHCRGVVTIQQTETFDSAVSAASDGWWEYATRTGSPTTAPYFGWSNTNLPTGSAGVGGGLIGRINNYDFYGTVFTNLGVMSLTNTLTMSGNFYIAHEATNNDLRFGYFQYDTINNALLNEDGDVIGFYFNEPHKPGPNNAMRIGVCSPPNNEVQAPFWVYAGTNYSWTWKYSPPPAGTNYGSITFTVLGGAAIDAAGDISTSNTFVYNIASDSLLATNNGQPFTAPFTGYTYNGFGIANPGGQGAKSADLSTIYYDNLSFTTVSNSMPYIPNVTIEPGILNLSLGTNTTITTTVTVTIPPQLIATSNYTLTVTSGNPSICVPTGTTGSTTITFPGVVANGNIQTITTNLSLTLGPGIGVTTLAWTAPGATVAPSTATTIILSQNPNVPPYPQVWLPFTNSTTTDLGLVNHNFSESGSAVLTSDAPPAAWAGTNALALDGGSYVVAGNASDINLNDPAYGGQGYTMCAWIKSALGDGVIASKSPANPGPFPPNPPADGFANTPAFLISTTGKLQEEVWQADTVLGTITVNDGNWHHVAVVYDGSLHKLYVDGVYNASAQGGAYKGANEGANVAVGEVVPWLFTVGETMNSSFPNVPFGNSMFTGEINNFLLWNLALSDSQISSVFQSGPPSVTVGFTEQPQSQTYLVGQTATFAVAATPIGTTNALTYQWTTNGINISGATRSSYTTPPLTLANNGVTYQCSVGVSNTTVLSQSALLTVLACGPITIDSPATTLYQQVTNQYVTVSIQPELNNGAPVSVQLISANPSVAVAADSSGNTLTLNFADNGATTQVVPINVLSSGSAEFYLTNAVANWCASTSNDTLSVTVPCLPVSLVAGQFFVEIGATNPLAVISLPLPAPLLISGPISVNLVSGNPGVVTPVGATGGSLTVTFTPGGTNSQTIPVQALAIGSANLTISGPSGPGCFAPSATTDTVTVVRPGVDSTKTETFDTLASTTADGWVGHNNQTPFANYGWTNNGDVAGTPGEAGGFFYRTNTRSYYADVTVGHLTLNDYITASGTVIIDTPPTNNDNIDVTYFNTADPDSNTNNNYMGIEFYEGANNGPNGRTATILGFANDTFQYGSPKPGTVVNQFFNAINWSFTYNPTAGPTGNGQVICTYSSEFGTASMTNNVSASQRAVGANFNAFGFATRNLPFQGAPGEYYLDNVSYTVGGGVQILNQAFSGAQATLTFESAGTNNVVQKTSSLSPPSWTTVPGVTFAGPTNLVWTATFTTPPAPAYFRVVANPSP